MNESENLKIFYIVTGNSRFLYTSTIITDGYAFLFTILCIYYNSQELKKWKILCNMPKRKNFRLIFLIPMLLPISQDEYFIYTLILLVLVEVYSRSRAAR